MSGASDKARFYLEQAVPQLQEFKEKKIFDDVSKLFSPKIRISNMQIQSRIIADGMLYRTKSETLSRNDPILNTRSLGEGHNRLTLLGMPLGRSAWRSSVKNDANGYE